MELKATSGKTIENNAVTESPHRRMSAVMFVVPEKSDNDIRRQFG